jgi:hypothetical protein
MTPFVTRTPPRAHSQLQSHPQPIGGIGGGAKGDVYQAVTRPVSDRSTSYPPIALTPFEAALYTSFQDSSRSCDVVIRSHCR